MASKIKQIIEQAPTGGILLSNWLNSQGIPRQEQASFVKTGWLERMCQGVYHVSTDRPRLFPMLNSLTSQSDFSYHIGAFTALDLKGFTHYGQLGKPKAYIYMRAKWPKRFNDLELEMTPVIFTSKNYEELGLTSVTADGVSLHVSSPERAIFECIDLIPEHANPMDTFYLMEMLSTLRSQLVESLLHKASIKTRRLFLYMAEKAGHPWFEDLNLENINLGSGDRSITPGGAYNAKYRIVIPQDLADYE